MRKWTDLDKKCAEFFLDLGYSIVNYSTMNDRFFFYDFSSPGKGGNYRFTTLPAEKGLLQSARDTSKGAFIELDEIIRSIPTDTGAMEWA